LSGSSPEGNDTIDLVVNGAPATIPVRRASLMEALREDLGVTSVKDGCAPQGQCGCCTVLIDGQPRVSCVTPVRRVAGRHVTTLDGLPDDERDAFVEAFTACGASQCGFCTPGIIVRLAGLHERGATTTPGDHTVVERALAAHLCRCTGWRPILDAWDRACATLAGEPATGDGERNLAAAEQRSCIEGGTPQAVGVHVAAGAAGFAADTAPPGALVAVCDPAGGFAVGATPSEAWAATGRVQGRHGTTPVEPPLAVPEGQWAVSLQTSWVEPAYLEVDASWCVPGGEPASPLANGGAFGAKQSSLVRAAARQLADHHGQPVRVVLTREDTVRLGPKRPPVAIGVRPDGTGVARVARTPGVADAIRAVAPGLDVEEVDVPGPPTSVDLRGAGWVEAAVAVAAATGGTTVTSPSGAAASARVSHDGTLAVAVACGDPLDEVVLRSYCTGAAHMALGWVTSEGLAVDGNGAVVDLTVRSFGVPSAAGTPAITVEVDPTLGNSTGPPVRGSDAVFAAVALAVWRHQGLPGIWPTLQPLRSIGQSR
jgi:xanthine dehydrogenase small subunit